MSVKFTYTWAGGGLKKSFPTVYSSHFSLFTSGKFTFAWNEYTIWGTSEVFGLRSTKRLGRWMASPCIDCGVSESSPQRDNNTWQRCRQHLFHAAFNSAGIMIKGNNQNECEHNKGSDAMGYYSPTGNDWALTGGWLNKLCSSLQWARPLVHLPASCWNLYLRLTKTTGKGAAEQRNVQMRGGIWGQPDHYIFLRIAIVFIPNNTGSTKCCVLLHANVILVTVRTWLHLSPLKIVVTWHREIVLIKATMWK